MRRLKQPAFGGSMRWKLPVGILALVTFVLIVLGKQIRYKQGGADLRDWYSKPRLSKLGDVVPIDMDYEGWDEWETERKVEDVQERGTKSWKERLRKGFDKQVSNLKKVGQGLTTEAARSAALEAVDGWEETDREKVEAKLWRIACVSNTRGWHREMRVWDGDLLIHAGGFTENGTVDELGDFNDWLGALPHRYKILVPRASDLGPGVGPKLPRLRQLLSHATAILVDSAFVLPGGGVIYGAPAPPAGEEDLEGGASKWDLIPLNIDVLVTDGSTGAGASKSTVGDDRSTVGIDRSTVEGLAGSPQLAEAIERTRPRLVVFGHVQHSYGVLRQAHCRRKGWLHPCQDALEAAPLIDGRLRIGQPSKEGFVYFAGGASFSGRTESKQPMGNEVDRRRQPLLIELEEEHGPANVGLAAWAHNRGQGPGWSDAFH